MATRAKSVADLVKTIDQIESALDDLSEVSTALFQDPEAAKALAGALTKMHGGVVAKGASQRVGAAEMLLRDYKKLLTDIAETTNLKWPPAAAVIPND